MDNRKNNKREINLKTVLVTVFKRKKLFLTTLPIAFVISCVIVLSIPRYYTCNVMLAPEADNNMSSMGSLASSFLGGDLKMTTDAISPDLYPDLMESSDFIVGLFGIRVRSLDGTIDTDYYTYMKKYQKSPWWGGISSKFFKLFEENDSIIYTGKEKKGADPFMLSREQDRIAKAIRGNVICSVDKKTSVITISATSQDKYICATIADSVRCRLQAFITNYRTSKARVDLIYYTKLTKEAKADYEKARKIYGSYADANTDVVLESYKSEQNELENDMQLKYNTYSTMMTQLQAAKARVQERTPAFTILQGASVPVKPAGPKRMLVVIGVLFLTFTGTLMYSLKDVIANQLKE